MFNIPNEIQYVLDILNQNHYEAYLVGGCVRDYLMHKDPHDYDITTNATPNEVKNCFKDDFMIETGLQHGTITLIIHHIPIEITTYRNETIYLDHRRPSSVTFSKHLNEDLKRRDFSMNAIAYHPSVGIIDLFHGKNDIINKRICCVGDPYQRFSEDALRILRALRFSSVLNFSIEESCSQAIHDLKYDLNYISVERIYSELKKIVCGTNFPYIITNYFDILCICMPPLDQINDIEEISKMMNRCDQNIYIRMALLLKNLSSNDLASIYKYLKFDNDTKHKISYIHKFIHIPLPNTKIELKQILSTYPHDNYFDVLQCLKAINPQDIKKIESVETMLHIIIDQSECYQIKDLAINGKDLILLGIPQGKQIKEILDHILQEVIQERLVNTYEQLINYIKNNILKRKDDAYDIK